MRSTAKITLPILQADFKNSHLLFASLFLCVPAYRQVGLREMSLLHRNKKAGT